MGRSNKNQASPVTEQKPVNAPEAKAVHETSKPAEELAEEVEAPKPSPVEGEINSEAQAVEYVRNNYQVPESVKTVYVTSDKQVFYRRNPAMLYQNETKVKLFAVTWD